MALAFAALIVFVFANAEPLMTLSIKGLKSTTTILGGVTEMWRQREWITSLLVALFAVVAPALEIGFMLVILLAVRRPPAPRWVGTLLRWAKISGLWSMVEVMTLGILVALVKIASFARVKPGLGIFAASALVVLLAAMAASFDPGEAWSRVRWAYGDPPTVSRGGVARKDAGP